MKKINLVICLAILILNNASGQWYTRKYKVSDINLLSRNQLEESLKQAKTNVLESSLIAASGIAIFAISKYSTWSSDEDPSLFEQVAGEEGKKMIGITVGTALFTGGVFATFGYMTRIKKIKSAIQKNFPAVGALHVSPAIIPDRFTTSCHLGVSLTYHF